ncbi:MAG: hypothetical protein SGILL_005979 [Bacillariaceae sp.]
MPRGELGTNYKGYQLKAYKPTVREARAQQKAPNKTFKYNHTNGRSETVLVFRPNKTKPADYHLDDDTDRLYNGRVTEPSSCECGEPKYCLSEEYEADHDLVKVYTLKQVSTQPVLAENLMDHTVGDGKTQQEQYEAVMNKLLMDRFDLAPKGFLARLNYKAFAKLLKAYVDVCVAGKDENVLTSDQQKELIETIVREKLEETDKTLAEMKEDIMETTELHGEFIQRHEERLDLYEQELAEVKERVTRVEERVDGVEGTLANVVVTQDEQALQLKQLLELVDKMRRGTAQPFLIDVSDSADLLADDCDADELADGFNILDIMGQEANCDDILRQYNYKKLCGKEYVNRIVKAPFISGRTLQSTQHAEWFDDNAIDGFLGLVSAWSAEMTTHSPYKTFSVMFYSLLTKGKPTNSRSFDYEAGSHWILAAIRLAQKRIQIYDSLGRRYPNVLVKLKKYLRMEYRNKKQIAMPAPHEWELDESTAATPRQTNGYDCGVFVCMYAYALSMGKDPSQLDPAWVQREGRKFIAASLLKGTILSASPFRD